MNMRWSELGNSASRPPTPTTLNNMDNKEYDPMSDIDQDCYYDTGTNQPFDEPPCDYEDQEADQALEMIPSAPA
eukprot:8666077-Pyramimonas_sp.AAC.1